MTRWLAVGSYVPSTTTAWIIFIGLCIALIVSRYAINRFFTNRHAARLDILMRESATFLVVGRENASRTPPVLTLRQRQTGVRKSSR